MSLQLPHLSRHSPGRTPSTPGSSLHTLVGAWADSSSRVQGSPSQRGTGCWQDRLRW